MRREAPGIRLREQQRRMAERGLKGLIPFHGRAYLDYVISAAADAGLRDVCLVVGPGTDAIRAHYEEVDARRVRLAFTVQEAPLGSANTLLAAEAFADGGPFLLINADNYYPAPVLARMRQLQGTGLAGFRSDVLVARGNIPATRLAAYALVAVDSDGCLAGILEKPDPEAIGRPDRQTWVSMTCWRFGRSIFEACRAIAPSIRGEYELPDAVAYAIREWRERYRVLAMDEAVLDLSMREDIESVEELLQAREVCL